MGTSMHAEYLSVEQRVWSEETRGGCGGRGSDVSELDTRHRILPRCNSDIDVATAGRGMQRVSQLTTHGAFSLLVMLHSLTIYNTVVVP